MPPKLDCENVNGALISLSVESQVDPRMSRKFKISFKTKPVKNSRPMLSLILAVLFNILAITYTSISLTSILIIFICMCFLLSFWVTHCVKSESILVIPTIGIQSSVQYVYGGEDKFLPWSCIDDIILNEVIQMHRVIYFLTVIVNPGNGAEKPGQTQLIPLFQYTKPRLAMLTEIYNELKTLLTRVKEELTVGAGDTGCSGDAVDSGDAVGSGNDV